jgi:hypothetical protein
MTKKVLSFDDIDLDFYIKFNEYMVKKGLATILLENVLQYLKQS